jgi:NAD(P)-dependent dehydrogenase (short-subunit alcohol dehydrogenase family)
MTRLSRGETWSIFSQLANFVVVNLTYARLSKALALEWARYGIRVNALAPGYFKTELNDDFFQEAAGHALIKRIPQRRPRELRELERLLLASEASSYMEAKRARCAVWLAGPKRFMVFASLPAEFDLRRMRRLGGH